MEPSTDNNGPLAGVRVLDLADEKASFCSKVLADLGALVIKVENPRGDSSRKIGPFWKRTGHPGKSLFFWYNNTNKFGITLDLEQSAHRELFCRQIEKSDVVVETFPPGHLDSLGLGFEDLVGLNQGLIMVSVTGFGQSGPRRDFNSCDLVASALGGQMHLCGSPSLRPIKLYGEQSYITASLHAAVGVLLALRKRAKTGRGDHIDISLQEAVTSTLEHLMVRYFHDRGVPERRGSRHWNDFFFIVPCKDGFIHLTPLLGWETIVDLLKSEGAAKDLSDEKWGDEQYRILNVDHVIEVLQGWTRLHTTDELFELGQLMRFPWAPVCSPKDVLSSPQLQARGFFSDIEHPELGCALQYPGVPYRFSDQYPVPRKRAPLLGEHNPVLDRLEPEFGQVEYGSTRVNERNQTDCLRREGILAGVRVLDFSRVLAGPYATRILGDFGAEVIKVQSKKTASGAEDNTGFYSSAWNRNKKSITLDLSHPEARGMVLKLSSISDVVVENFSPRVMSNWRLDYEKLKEMRENLIMVSMSGMGQTGPWQNFVAFGHTVQSLGGLTYLTSYDENSPVGLPYAHADTISGLYCAIAILAALGHRERTGLGQYIDLSEYEAVCTLLGPTLLDAAAHSKEILPEGIQISHVPAGPYGRYKCLGKDRWCVIAVYEEAQWHALCRVSGHPEWAQDKRFHNLEMR
jgi:crotonobetainyl-CoA:carnitine CoA-transferase CaiB-like acyl-CoA transferase